MARKLTEGTIVTLNDPLQIAVRFYDPARRVIVGTYGQAVPRACLDQPGVVATVGKAGRVRVAWPTTDDIGPTTTSMWLDASIVTPIRDQTALIDKSLVQPKQETR